MAKPKASKKAKLSIITPIIPEGAPQHIFQTMESEGALPILRSVGYARVAPNSRDYVAYVITSRGSEVLDIQVCEPNLQAIASDEAKISFVTLFEDQDQTLEEDRRHIEAEAKRKATAKKERGNGITPPGAA